MPNQVFGPYSTTSWVNGTTAANATNMNHLETQASIALNGFNGDLVTPFVLSGIVASKDGTVANQLDVTSGRAYLKMSDNTVGLIATAASTASQFLTTTPSTTYYLFLKNDGTWQWGTTSTGPTNSLAIASATTDGSSNINVVTDMRTTTTTLLPTFVSGTAPQILLGAGHATVGLGTGVSGSYAGVAESLSTPGTLVLRSALSGAAPLGLVIATWNGSTQVQPFSVGGQFSSASTWIGSTGKVGAVAGQATAGNFGVPPIVAQLIDQAVTDTLFHSFTLATVPATGLYRVTAQFYIDVGTARLITLSVSFTQGHSGSATSQAFISNSAAGHGKLWDGSGTGDSAAAGDAPGSSFELYLSGGTSISVRFQDPGWTSGTDRVNAILERLT